MRGLVALVAIRPATIKTAYGKSYLTEGIVDKWIAGRGFMMAYISDVVK